MTELGLSLSFSQYVKISTAIAYDVENFNLNFSRGHGGKGLYGKKDLSSLQKYLR